MSVPAELEDSIKKYESYVKADPHNALLWLALGDFYHRAGRFEEAIASFERSLIEAPGHAAARGRIASVRISQHRFGDAEAILHELLRTAPDDPALLYNLGLAQFYQDKWAESQESFSRAHSLGLKTNDNLAYLTRALHHLGKTREAIEFCTQWVTQAADDKSQAYLSLLEMDDGNMARARELAQQVLARDPDNIEAGTVAGTWSIEQQDMEAAGRLFSRILERQPNNPRAWLGLGLIRLYEQNHADAIAALEKAVSLMPDNSGTVVALAWARLAARDALGAEKVFRQAIAVDRNFAEAHGGLASSLALQARIDEAQQAIRIAKRLDPANFGARFAETVVLKTQGQAEQATQVLAELLDSAPVPGAPTLVEHLRTYGTKQLQSSPPPRPGHQSDAE